MIIKLTLKCLLLFLIGAMSITSAQELPTFSCKMDQFAQCIFVDIELNNTQSRFRPQSDNSSFVEIVGFRNSHIPVFNRDVCDEFPETRTMRLHDLGIQTIATDAFENCKELTHLTFFSGNHLTELDIGTFQHNTKLVALDLEGNRLKSFDHHILDPLTHLRDLHLQDNRLESFGSVLPESRPVNVGNVKYLYLHNNRLFDVQVTGASLKEVSLYGNYLTCYRVGQLYEELSDDDVAVFQRYEPLPEYLEASRFENTSCLTAREWIAVRSSLTSE